MKDRSIGITERGGNIGSKTWQRKWNGYANIGWPGEIVRVSTGNNPVAHSNLINKVGNYGSTRELGSRKTERIQEIL